MRLRRHTTSLIALAATASVLAAGCGKSTDGAAASVNSGGDSTTTSSATPVTPGDKDPGKFRTTPQPEFGTAGSDNMGRIVDGQRMAEFVVLPGEIDPQLSEEARAYVYKTGSALRVILTEGVPEAADRNGMINGFSTHRSTGGDDPQLKKSLVHAVLRFPDAGSVTKAIAEMSQASLSNPQVPYQPGAIDILPNSTVTTRDEPASKLTSAESYTPHGNYIIYDWVQAPLTEKDFVAKTIADAVAKQGPLIDKFPITPVDKLPEEKIDIDHVLKYAVPEEDGNRSVGQNAVYGPRGAAHFASNDMLNLKNFGETGTTRKASDGTNVYLSKNEVGSKSLFERFSKEQAESFDEPSPIAGPPGVNNVDCVSARGGMTGKFYYCLVQKGRYLGEIIESDQKKAMQKTTAQSMIFDKIK